MKKITIISISFVIFFIFSLNLYYKNNQQILMEESNRLYSLNSLNIETSFDDFITDKEITSKPFRLFYQVENNSIDIRAFYSNNYSFWQAPVIEGRFFKKNNELTAIIGFDVPIRKENNKSFFIYNNKKYEIIGYLSKNVPEYFNNSVLISDSSFFNNEYKQYVLDGEHLNNIDHIATVISDNNSGIGRFLEVDFFSPLIQLFSFIILVSSTIFLSYIYNYIHEPEMKILYLIGFNYISLLKNNLFILNKLFRL